MKITHRNTPGGVVYTNEDTGIGVLVSVFDLKAMKSTAQLMKLLKDRGLLDKPKYPKHKDCDSRWDKARCGVFYHATRSRKMCFVSWEALKGMSEEALDTMLIEMGMFRMIEVMP